MTVWLLLSWPLLAAAGEAIPPSLVTLDGTPRSPAEIAAIIEKQTGNKLDVHALRSDVLGRMLNLTVKSEPFWKSVESLAAATHAQIDVNPKTGISLRHQDGRASAPSSIDGAFRVVAKSVNLRKSFDTGVTRNEVTLEIQWEPRLPVFRIDAQPSIAKAEDNRGIALKSERQNTKNAIGGVHSFATTLPLEGLTRDAKSIAVLEGTITATASPRMLSVSFSDLNAKLPATESKDGVAITLTRLAPVDDRLEIEIKLHYPDSQPEFESFESWTDFNKLRIISADRTRTWSPENFSTSGNGRRVTAEYRFLKLTPAEIKGASLVYETPAPLVEFPVKLTLKDITLP